MIIPEHKIEEIREATDIVDLISGYVTLKKKGQNYFGLCPFHQEKTASFSVNAAKQIFHCFGCHAGGNVFTFLMRHEGLSFPEAAQFLARRAGIALELQEQDETVVRETETLYFLNESATTFFRRNLAAAQGEEGRAYLQQRGIPQEIIERFELGYALPEWDALARELSPSFKDDDILLKAGLILKKESGGYYDRFRDRIIFPIRNLSGRVVAFGGRILKPQENAPKYINSPDTPVYSKGKALYGLFQTRDDIRHEGSAVFVEGYMDFLALYAAGIRNVVATLGTSLTEDQARLIRRYTKKVVLLYDSDEAGIKATLRGADILLEADVDVAVVILPEKHDPDSFVREKGEQKLREYIDQAGDIFDFRMKRLSGLPPESRGDEIRQLLESLSHMKDRIGRNLILSKISEKLHIGEKVLWTELEYILRNRGRNRPGSSSVGRQLSDLGKVAKASRLEKAAEDLVRILLHHWEYAALIFANLEMSDVEATKVYPLLKYLNNRFKGEKPPAEEEIVHHLHDVELTSFVLREAHATFENIDVEKWALDCVVTIKIEMVQRQINLLREQIKMVGGSGGDVQHLLKECMELEKYKKEISAFVT